jgi:hypothetical protein
MGFNSTLITIQTRFSPENNGSGEGNEYGENTLHICDLSSGKITSLNFPYSIVICPMKDLQLFMAIEQKCWDRYRQDVTIPCGTSVFESEICVW